MDDKKVILNKTEFDKMEADLQDFASIIESKTVCKIAVPRSIWTSFSGASSPYCDIKYVIGCDENEVLKELSSEIEKLQEEKQELNQTINGLKAELRWHNNQKDDWKDLPWYKKLFV